MPPEVYNIAKTIHFIGLVSWFAALFYLPRLFIYHTEALQKSEPERSILCQQFELMEKRLYGIIMTPAMVLTLIGGTTMLVYYGWDWFISNIWMHWKLGFVFILIGYHYYSKGIIQKLAKGTPTMTSTQLRYYNEIATIILLAVVLLAVFKNRLSFIYAFAAIILFGMLLSLGIRAYKKYRQKEEKKLSIKNRK